MTDRNDSAYGEGAVAWDDPATRRAWRRQTGRSLALLAGLAGWWAFYVTTSVAVREQLIWLCVPLLLFSLVRIPLEVFAELPNALLVRRMLLTRPWHSSLNPPHGVSDHPAARDTTKAWFEVPDPTAPERRVPLIFFSAPPLWWGRRMRAEAPPDRKEQIAALWYCGVPGEKVTIGASRPTDKAPLRMRHLDLRTLLVAPPGERPRPDAPVPHPSLNAMSHRPTRHTMRRRLRNRVALLLLAWPALFALQVAEVVADEDHDKIGLIVIALILEVFVLPLHIYVIVTTRRMTRTLAANPWRLVDCDIRSRGRAQLIGVGGQTLTPSPWRAYVNSTAAQLWIAGHPHRQCVISEPGGSRPIGVAMIERS